MATMKVLRKTLTGTSEAYAFDVIGYRFCVKNFSDNDCYVNYEAITASNEDTSVKVPKGTAQVVFSNENNTVGAGTLYVKGTGEVEVQVLAW